MSRQETEDGTKQLLCIHSFVSWKISPPVDPSPSQNGSADIEHQIYDS